MSGSKRREAKTSIQDLFSRFGGKPAEETRKKRPSPLSLRLTEGQRAELERRAGRKPLGGYVKECLFDGGGPSEPSKDDQRKAYVRERKARSRRPRRARSRDGPGERSEQSPPGCPESLLFTSPKIL